MCCRALGCPMVQVAVSCAAGCQRVPQIRRSPGLASSPGRGLPLAQMAPSPCSSTILLHGSPLLGAEHRTCPANFSRRDWSWAQRRGSVSGAAELPALKSRCERWEPSSSSWWSEFNFRGEGESAKQTECCSGGFSLPPLGPLPTVFIDFNHWRLASSQKKHCVMCSFLAFIKETQCSAVTLPSAPGNLPTPCGTSFIGGDGARGLLGFFGCVFLLLPPLQHWFQNSFSSASTFPEPTATWSREGPSAPGGDDGAIAAVTASCAYGAPSVHCWLWGAAGEPRGCGYKRFPRAPFRFPLFLMSLFSWLVNVV